MPDWLKELSRSRKGLAGIAVAVGTVAAWALDLLGYLQTITWLAPYARNLPRVATYWSELGSWVGANFGLVAGLGIGFALIGRAVSEARQPPKPNIHLLGTTVRYTVPNDEAVWVHVGTHVPIPGRYRGLVARFSNVATKRKVSAAEHVRANIDFRDANGRNTQAYSAPWLDHNEAEISISVGEVKEILVALQASSADKTFMGLELSSGSARQDQLQRYLYTPYMLAPVKMTITLLVDGIADKAYGFVIEYDEQNLPRARYIAKKTLRQRLSGLIAFSKA